MNEKHIIEKSLEKIADMHRFLKQIGVMKLKQEVAGGFRMKAAISASEPIQAEVDQVEDYLPDEK